MRIGLLHLAPRLGDLDGNCASVEAALAEVEGAELVVTPELCLSGWAFAPEIGTSWIRTLEEDPWVSRLRAAAARRGVALVLGHALRVEERCYNAAVVLGSDGAVLGVHHKVQVVPGVEAWATRGRKAAPIRVGSEDVGVLVCADAWKPDTAAALAAGGASILVSPVAWPPEPHHPERCWARRSAETGLPLVICNRAGREGEHSFDGGESAVFHGGERVWSTRDVGVHVVRAATGAAPRPRPCGTPSAAR